MSANDDCTNKSSGWKNIDYDKEIEIGDLIGGGGVGMIYKGWYKDEPVSQL